MKKNQKQFYHDVCYSYLFDYLIFSKSIEQDLNDFKDSIVNEEFLKKLNGIIEEIAKYTYYPKKTFNQITKILDFIEEEDNSLESLVTECFKSLEDMTNFSDEKYYEEFLIKQTDLEEFTNNEYHIWYKDDIEESIRFDFYVLLSLISNDDAYLENFLLNRNYLYAIRKIITTCQIDPKSSFLQTKNIREKIEHILKMDLKLIDKYNEEIITEFIIKNYHETYLFQLADLEKFKREIEVTLASLKKYQNEQFDIDELNTYLNQLNLENYLFFNSNINPTDISLDTIYLYIEKMQQMPVLNSEEKDKLLNLMDAKKENFDSRQLQEYNYYLVMFNEIEPSIYGKNFLFLERIDFIDLLKYYFKGDIKTKEAVLKTQKYDLAYLKTLLASDAAFDIYKHFVQIEDYELSIKRFMRDIPSLFSNEKVRKRVLEILQNQDDRYAKKIKKNILKR